MKSHVLKIARNDRREVAEMTPRYDVFLNGNKVDELYFNTRGYSASLPTIQGYTHVIPETSIEQVEKAVRRLNREAKKAIEAAASDPRKITSHVPSEDNRFVYAFSFVKGEDPQAHLISRKSLIRSREMFGADPIGAGFFIEDQIGPDSPVALLTKDASWVPEEIPTLKARMMTPGEIIAHGQSVADSDVHRTEDPETLIVVGRDGPEDEYPDVVYVTRTSYDFAKRTLGTHLRVGDLTRADPARVESRKSLDILSREFPDEDFLLEGDAAERHEREQAAISEGYRMEKEQGAPLDAAHRHDVEQMKLTGVPAPVLPPRGDTPEKELDLLNAWVREAGGYVQVHFEGESDDEDFSVRSTSGKMNPEVEERFVNLTKIFLSEEMGNWSEGAGATGSLLFEGKEEPWLNADAVQEDWSYERHVENVEDMEWPEEPDDGPSPS